MFNNAMVNTNPDSLSSQLPTEAAKAIRQTEALVEQVWGSIRYRAAQQFSETELFPYHLLMKQKSEINSVITRTYLASSIPNPLQSGLCQIESGILALHNAVKAIELSFAAKTLHEINAILVAIKVLFIEFKDNKEHNCEQRLTAFLAIISALLCEAQALLTEK